MIIGILGGILFLIWFTYKIVKWILVIWHLLKNVEDL
jgi:hypothetical protein